MVSLPHPGSPCLYLLKTPKAAKSLESCDSAPYVPGPLRKVLHLVRLVPLKVKRRGVEMRLIINGGDQPRMPDPALLKAFARARGWFEELASGRARSLVEIARREGLAKRYVTRLTKLVACNSRIGTGRSSQSHWARGAI